MWGGSVNEVCMEVTGCGDGCVGMGVGVWVGEWVFDKWHNYMLILIISMSILCLTQFDKKVD